MQWRAEVSGVARRGSTAPAIGKGRGSTNSDVPLQSLCPCLQSCLRSAPAALIAAVFCRQEVAAGEAAAAQGRAAVEAKLASLTDRLLHMARKEAKREKRRGRLHHQKEQQPTLLASWGDPLYPDAAQRRKSCNFPSHYSFLCITGSRDHSSLHESQQRQLAPNPSFCQ